MTGPPYVAVRSSATRHVRLQRNHRVHCHLVRYMLIMKTGLALQGMQPPQQIQCPLQLDVALQTLFHFFTDQ